jgi:hypothetical protein
METTLSAADHARATPVGATVKDLETRWRRLSPRVTVPSTPWVSHAISGATLVLWLLLLAAPFGLKGVFVWSAGIVYAAYDTVLLVFTFFETLALLRPALPAPPYPGGFGRRAERGDGPAGNPEGPHGSGAAA